MEKTNKPLTHPPEKEYERSIPPEQVETETLFLIKLQIYPVIIIMTQGAPC